MPTVLNIFLVRECARQRVRFLYGCAFHKPIFDQL
eukprot:COSAG02_NODE_20534_length_826_cov_49040.632737_1_plen_34_part_10